MSPVNKEMVMSHVTIIIFEGNGKASPWSYGSKFVQMKSQLKPVARVCLELLFKYYPFI